MVTDSGGAGSPFVTFLWSGGIGPLLFSSFLRQLHPPGSCCTSLYCSLAQIAALCSLKVNLKQIIYKRYITGSEKGFPSGARDDPPHASSPGGVTVTELKRRTSQHTHITYTNTPSYTNLGTYSNKTHNTCATTYTSHTYSSAHNYTSHVQNDVLNYPATFSEFQDNAEQFRSSAHPQNAHQDEICDNLIHRGRRIEKPMYSKTEEKDNR